MAVSYFAACSRPPLARYRRDSLAPVHSNTVTLILHGCDSLGAAARTAGGICAQPHGTSAIMGTWMHSSHNPQPIECENTAWVPGACSQYSIRSNRPKLKETRRTMLLHAFAMVGGHEHHQLVSLNRRLQWCDPTARPGGVGSLELLRVAKELLVQPADRPLVLELDLIFCTIVVSKIIDAVDQRSNERVTYSK